MAEPEHGLVIELEETGEQWSAITEWSINDAFDVDTDEWSATVFTPNDPAGLRRKFLPKSRVKLYVNGNLQVIGRIDRTDDATGTALRLTGHDYLADLVAPGMDESVRIGGGMTLADALKLGLKPYGITEIETSIAEVMNRKIGKATMVETDVPTVAAYTVSIAPRRGFAEFGTTTFKRATYEEVPEHRPQFREGALQWASRLSARVGGYSIQPGSKRSALALVKPDYSSQVQFEFRRFWDQPEKTNVESARASRDWTDVPSVIALRGRRITGELEVKDEHMLISPLNEPFGKIDEVKRIFEASRAVNGRVARTKSGTAGDFYIPVYLRDDQTREKAHLENQGRRMLAERARKTLDYVCSLNKFASEDGRIFCTNVLSYVTDNISDVNEPLWIRERTIGYQRGSRCNLHLIRPGSYVL